MSQTEKAEYYKRLKDAGVTFTKHYREYSTDQLRDACTRLETAEPEQAPVPPPPSGPAPQPINDGFGDGPPPPPNEPPETGFDPVATQQAFESFAATPDPTIKPEDFEVVANAQPRLGGRQPQQPPPRGPDPNEMPGQRLNTKTEDEVLRVDEYGREWIQEEIRKPAMPAPRRRRVLTYTDPGTVEQTVRTGDFTETFEIAGDGEARTSEVKITMPSYQVGIFRDRRFPMFKVHIYNDIMGFNFFDVCDFYGGKDLVPTECKRMYVSNDLCFDIRSTVRAIEMEYRRLQLAGRNEEL